jgi:hypothetical protein
MTQYYSFSQQTDPMGYAWHLRSYDAVPVLVPLLYRLPPDVVSETPFSYGDSG